MNIEILEKEFGEAQQAICDKFKLKMKSLADEIIGEFYCDVTNYASTDAHINYHNYLRNEWRKSFIEGVTTKYSHYSDFHHIRMDLLNNHHERLQNKIISDLQEKIISLEDHIEQLRKRY